MAGSLGLALYLIAAGRAAEGAGRDLPLPPLAGARVWLHAPEAGVATRVMLALACRLVAARPGLGVVLTHPPGALPPSQPLPPRTLALPALPDDPALMRRALGRWSPGAVVIADGPLPAALIHAAEQADRHAFLVDAGPPRLDPRWAALPGLQRTLLRRLRRILARDAEAARALRRAGARPWRLEEAGPMAQTAGPQGCNAAEREALAARLGGRPLWLAVAVPEAEEAAVLAAQRAAQRLAHRLLLVLVPADPARGPVLAEAAAAVGLNTARRAAEEEPDDDDQVYIADTEGEYGLWYRLAPVTFMGGTLTGQGGRSPMEPAALGSAVIHGPATGAHDELYTRLGRAGASWRVPGSTAGPASAGAGGASADRSGAALPRRGAEPGQGLAGRGLGRLRGLLGPSAAGAAALPASPAGAEAVAEAVVALLAPDRVALMARAGWTVATEGTEATDHVVALVLAALDEVGAP